MADLGRVVLDLLAPDGDVLLPSLTREELKALGDEPVLAYAPDEQWWAALDQRSRDLVAETAQRGLIARNLIVASETGPALAVAARVQVVLQARQQPSWLIVLGEPGPPDAEAVQVALSGIDLAEHDTSAVLASTRIEGIYAHRLTRPAIAIDAAVGWLLRPPPSAPPVPVGRTVEVLLPVDPGRDRIVDTRAIVIGTGSQWRLSRIGPDEAPGEPEPIEASGLRAFLVDSVVSLAQR